MIQQTIKEAFDQIVVEKITPFMKQLKFSRQNRMWNRRRGKFIDVIEIQLSKSCRADYVSCTVNSAVYFDPVNEIVWDKKKRKFVREFEGLVRARAGQLLYNNFAGKEYDTWWNIERIENLGDITNNLICFIMEYVLPFFEKFNFPEEIEQFMIARKDYHSTYPLFTLQLAVLQVLMGKVDEGKEKLVCMTKNPKGWPENAQEILQRLEERGLIS